MRLALITLILAVLVVGPFVIWGEEFELLLDGGAAVEWLRQFGPVAGIVAVGLLTADVFLPLPSSSIMAALGILYGPLIGGILAALGSAAAGIAAFLICRFLGRPAALRLLGDRALTYERPGFEALGMIAIAGSRALPVLAEITAGLAGFYRMPFARFIAALSIGAVFTGFGFALLGHLGRGDPVLTVIIATIIPPIVSLFWFRFRARNAGPQSSPKSRGKQE